MKTYTKTELKALNVEKGKYFFKPDTMRFFKSKLETTGRAIGGEIFFITSEVPPHGKREYSVRAMREETGTIKHLTIRFGSLRAAKEKMRDLILTVQHATMGTGHDKN